MIVYDLEIANPIRPRTPDLEIPGVVYANGWQDYGGMGFAVLVAAWIDPYCRPQRFKVYDQKRLWEIEADFKGHEIPGFNSRSFDDNVLAHLGIEIRLEHKNAAIETSYDVLEQVRAASGQPRTFTPGQTRKGYNLDALAAANGYAKTGNGGDYAPRLFQQGRWAELVDYCLNDVVITCHLMRLGIQGLLKDPTNGELLILDYPGTALEEQQWSEEYLTAYNNGKIAAGMR